MKKELKRRGYLEVMTPNIFSTELFEISGHMDKYKENIFMIDE